MRIVGMKEHTIYCAHCLSVYNNWCHILLSIHSRI